MADENQQRIARRIARAKARLKKIRARGKQQPAGKQSLRRTKLVMSLQETVAQAEYGNNGGISNDAPELLDEADGVMEEVDDMDGESSQLTDAEEPDDQPDEEAPDLSDEPTQPREDQTRQQQLKTEPGKRPSAKSGLKPTPKVPSAGGAAARGAATAATAGSGAAATAGTAAAAGGAAVSWPVILVIVGVLVIILIVITLVACSANKSASESGGSGLVPTEQNNAEHQSSVAAMRALVDNGSIVATGSTATDLQGDGLGKLDYRIVKMLAYLGSKYRIGLALLNTNAPDFTGRQVSSPAAADVAPDKKTIDAVSAYKLGQAVAIDSIGVVPPEMAEQCPAIGAGESVKVAWQEVAGEGLQRTVYEQLMADGNRLFVQVRKLSQLSRNGLVNAGTGSFVSSNMDEIASALTLMSASLTQLQAADQQLGLASAYAPGALGKLDQLKSALSEGSWADPEEELEIPVSDFIFYVSQMLRTANMEGWEGNTANNCRLWKAYEARKNIRTLVKDVLRMPVELAGVGGAGFDSMMIAKQIIVFSPEDDLDNGPDDRDVFPPGITGVSERGATIGSADGGDGKVDIRDNQFMSLAIDNGSFAKVCTVFVYNQAGPEAQLVLDKLTADPNQRQLCALLYGDESGPSTGVRGVVTYKKFVHIGF